MAMVIQVTNLPMVQQYAVPRNIHDLKNTDTGNREGYVIRFASGLRVKVKFEEYCRLHRILDGVTKRTIWQYLKEGVDFDSILEKVPDEFYNWVRDTRRELQASYAAVEARARAEFRLLETRRETAQYFLQECTDPPILFRMLDGKPYADLIWKQLYPAHETPWIFR